MRKGFNVPSFICLERGSDKSSNMLWAIIKRMVISSPCPMKAGQEIICLICSKKKT